MHTDSQGQWWSYLSTQWLHAEQWIDRIGRYILHSEQYFCWWSKFLWLIRYLCYYWMGFGGMENSYYSVSHLNYLKFTYKRSEAKSPDLSSVLLALPHWQIFEGRSPSQPAHNEIKEIAVQWEQPRVFREKEKWQLAAKAKNCLLNWEEYLYGNKDKQTLVRQVVSYRLFTLLNSIDYILCHLYQEY